VFTVILNLRKATAHFAGGIAADIVSVGESTDATPVENDQEIRSVRAPRHSWRSLGALIQIVRP